MECHGGSPDRVVERWAVAFNANDAQELERLYTPDALLFGTGSEELGSGLAAVRRYFAWLPGSGASVRIGAHATAAVGADGAVSTGLCEFTSFLGGTPAIVPARFTFVLVRRDGAWRILHHHSSRRPTGAAG